MLARHTRVFSRRACSQSHHHSRSASSELQWSSRALSSWSNWRGAPRRGACQCRSNSRRPSTTKRPACLDISASFPGTNDRLRNSVEIHTQRRPKASWASDTTHSEGSSRQYASSSVDSGRGRFRGRSSRSRGNTFSSVRHTLSSPSLLGTTSSSFSLSVLGVEVTVVFSSCLLVSLSRTTSGSALLSSATFLEACSSSSCRFLSFEFCSSFTSCLMWSTLPASSFILDRMSSIKTTGSRLQLAAFCLASRSDSLERDSSWLTGGVADVVTTLCGEALTLRSTFFFDGVNSRTKRTLFVSLSKHV
ncbi:hypothetical protein MRX96_035988 [Rhipicephalus microplus]